MSCKTVETSAAFAATSKPAKRIYRLLVAEIAGAGRRNGRVEITVTEIMAAINLSSSSSLASSIRELAALGLVVVGKGKRGCGIYALATDWEAVTDIEQAKAIASAARLPPKRKPLTRAHVRSKRKKVEAVQPDAVEAREPEPEPRVRPITLPEIRWPSERGMALLEMDR